MRTKRRTVAERNDQPSGNTVVIDADAVSAASGGYTDPASLDGDGNNGNGNGGTGDGERKRRGRPRGTTRAKTAENISVEGLSNILLNLHGLLAGVTNVPELALDPTEAKSLSQATADVMRHYPNAVISPKTVDTLNFAMVVGAIYGTRFMAIRMRRQEERASSRAKPVDATVTRPAQQQARPATPQQNDENVAHADPNFHAQMHFPPGGMN